MEKIPRNGVIYQQTIKPTHLFYQCSKDDPDFLFGKSSIRDSRGEPCFSAKIKIIMSNLNEYVV